MLRNGCDFTAQSDQKDTRLKVKECRLNVQRFDIVLSTNNVQRKKTYERWFLSLFRFRDRGCKCLGTLICWWIHTFEYSANDFYNQFKNFLFLMKMFCQGSEAVFGLVFPYFVFVFRLLFIAVRNFTQNFISFDKCWLYCSYCLSCISSPPVLKPF